MEGSDMSLGGSAGLLGRVDAEAVARVMVRLQAEEIAAVAQLATGAEWEVAVGAEGAVVGSRSQRLFDREVGTVDQAPQPTLAGVAATHAAAAAGAIAGAVADALRGG
jgi:hypothetical protein